MPRRKEWLPTSGELHGQRSLVSHSPWGCRVGHDWVINTFTFKYLPYLRWKLLEIPFSLSYSQSCPENTLKIHIHWISILLSCIKLIELFPSSLSFPSSKNRFSSDTFYRESSVQFQFSHSVVSDSLWSHELQHSRPPCPSPTPRVHPNSCPSSQWCHPAISSSVTPFSYCSQSLPSSESFPRSQLFTWCGQSIGVSALASVLPKNTQDWYPLEWTGWISLQFKGLSRVKDLNMRTSWI